ncbi:MAG: T9SS type A sorting domain-containing protein [Ferruginibacter sp.]
MKKNFTYALLLCLVFSLANNFATAQGTFQQSFTATPTLLTGTANQVGAKYRFANVSAGTDAIVIISAINGNATISVLDNNGISAPAGFSPNITIPANKTGWVEFQISFVITNTLINKSVDSLYATAIDIDGASTLKEMDVINLGGGISSFVAANPEITVTQNGTAFTGLNVRGVDYPSIDTSAKVVMFTVKNSNVTTFTYRAGAVNSGSSSSTRQKSIYFKNFYYPAGGSLPVKYSSFDAAAANSVVTLNWVTEQEINNDHFEVERSFDGTNFSTVAIVLDGFATGSQKSYKVKDNAAELATKAVAYYRLKQIDNNGRITYSNVLTVRLQSKTSDVKMQVSPNPFVENLNIQFSSTVNAKAQVQVLSVNGQKVFTQQTTITKGSNSIQVQGLSKLIPGMYIAQLIINGVIIDNQKIIKN